LRAERHPVLAAHLDELLVVRRPLELLPQPDRVNRLIQLVVHGGVALGQREISVNFEVIRHLVGRAEVDEVTAWGEPADVVCIVEEVQAVAYQHDTGAVVSQVA
jgi:hypothetical protein